MSNTRALEGKVAVVAGGSRGAGRGIALALGDAGAAVYVAGRSARGSAPPRDGAPGTIDDTADEVTARGGRGIAARADLTVEQDVAALFQRVRDEQGRLDLLANAVWGGNEAWSLEQWSKPFWEQRDTFHETMLPGPYAYLLASRHAARMMVPQKHGLIVCVTDGFKPDGTNPFIGELGFDLSHACIDRLAFVMSRALEAHGVAVVPIMPGFMRTERVLRHVQTEEQFKAMGLDRGESPEYLGRGVAALAADPKVLERSGKLVFAADLARDYGFTDVDGKQPPRFVW